MLELRMKRATLVRMLQAETVEEQEAIKATLPDQDFATKLKIETKLERAERVQVEKEAQNAETLQTDTRDDRQLRRPNEEPLGLRGGG
jgi:hypothetical protein